MEGHMHRPDFNEKYTAGGTDPLSWDVENLSKRISRELTDDDGEGIYEASLVSIPAAREDKNKGFEINPCS